MLEEVFVGIVVKLDLDMRVLFEMASFVEIKVQGRDDMRDSIFLEEVLSLGKCMQAANVQIPSLWDFVNPSHGNGGKRRSIGKRVLYVKDLSLFLFY